MLTPSPIAASLAAITRRMGQAAQDSGRLPGEIRLVAVSKTHPAGAVLQAVAAGQLIFGENRVQEAQAKFDALRADHPQLKLHLIGGLQTNKASQAVRIADTIESLDRPALAAALLRAADKTGRLPDLFVQVNIGDEPQKSGVPPHEADAFVEHCMRLFGEKLVGLMCIPPAGHDPAPYFTALAAMRGRHGLAMLSMGMSSDFEAAIRCGATHVRVGSGIFGSR